MSESPIENALNENKTAQQAFRTALLAYRGLTGEPAPVLFDGRAPNLRTDAFENCRVFSNRQTMLKALAKGETAAEVGVQHGNFSHFILAELGVETLHLFDMNISQIRPDVRNDPRVRVHEGDSSHNLATLAEGSLDWCYIDGDHRLVGASKDARVASQRTRPGGTLFFNDYTPWSAQEVMPYGVMTVVNRLVNDGHDMLGVALNYWGYFDVALQN